MSLLLLDKNTQVVNTHGLVGGLLDINYVLNTELGASEEIDLGLSYYGLYLLSCPTNGGTAFYKIGSTTSCFLHGDKSGGSELFGDFTSSGSEKIIFGRKDFGGNIFVKNNDVRTLSIRIKMIRG